MKFKKVIKLESGLQKIDIVPFINIIFLIIIFFIVASNFVLIPGINVKLPSVLTLEEIGLKSLTLIVSKENEIYVGNQRHTLKEIEDFIKKSHFGSIFIKADRAANLGVVVEIWGICKRLGIERIGLATTYGD
jgi:biopolymer transport protein ExbD